MKIRINQSRINKELSGLGFLLGILIGLALSPFILIYYFFKYKIIGVKE